jgi:hypothetical protein
MVLAEGLLALASLAGRTVVSAAAADAWESAKTRLAKVFGRGNAERTQLAEERLQETQAQLAKVTGPELERVRAEQSAAWQARLRDLLEEHPDAAADLQAAVDQIRAQLPGGTVAAAGQGVAAGRDLTITASGGGVAAGTIHGSVSTGNPTQPGPPEG